MLTPYPAATAAVAMTPAPVRKRRRVIARSSGGVGAFM
jgi:hypothetical protein